MITEEFRDYTAAELAVELSFIEWVKCPNAESDQFWKEYCKSYPHQLSKVEKARAIVKSMHVIPDEQDSQSSDLLWERIKDEVNQMWRKNRRTKIVYLRRWAAAAVVLILLGGAAYFQFFKNPSNEIASKDFKPIQNAQGDVLPGGNKAILTLGDGSTILLDSSENGSLAQQGSSKVVKLADGKIAYQPSGTNDQKVAIQYNTVSTPRGGLYELVLSDGSKVWLNAASSIRFPARFTGVNRTVTITGEAYFEVAHQENHPFRVKVNDVVVQVLGTHFNVNAYTDEKVIRATLVQGSVKLLKGNEEVMLSPGEQASVDKKSREITKNRPNIEEVVAWKDGLFDFQMSSITSIMRQVSRWYNIDVEYEGDIPDKKFNGKIYRNANLSQVLMILKEGGIDFKVEGNKILVMP